MSSYPLFFPTSLKNGLVSYWALDNNSNDYYGYNNGTDTAISYTATTPNGEGYAANFNGNTSKITLAPITDSSFSISFWIFIMEIYAFYLLDLIMAFFLFEWMETS